jgi:hypothetical protein
MSERLSSKHTDNNTDWWSRFVLDAGEKVIDLLFGNGILQGPFSDHGTELQKEIELMQTLNRERPSSEK